MADDPRLSLGALALLVAAGAGCAPGQAWLRVQDEHGDPLPGAWAEVEGQRLQANDLGELSLGSLERPLLVVVGAEQHLSEPVPVGLEWAGQQVEVRLWSNPEGRRFALHAGGDAMLSRRYLQPDEGEALVVTGDEGASARRVVSDLAPAFGLADLVMLNLETAVGELPEDDAYPGKRYLLQSPPEVLAALDELGVDLVGLANNHVRDWLDEGVDSTLALLDEAGLARTGAGMDAEEAAQPAWVEVNGARVAVLAFSSLGGETVNDELPTDASRAPADPSSSASPWKWEARSWGWPELGVEVAERRAGSAWFLFEELESQVDAQTGAEIWASVIEVYPELQDLLARRGHGGASGWWGEESAERIAQAAAEAEVVVVQLHSGVEYAPVPTQALARSAREAIDAGASIVFGHHPHVLQGVEWYKGAPIFWSLGNLFFDQNRYITFPAAMVRSVWEADGSLLELRLLPLYMDGYRPVPVVDGAGRGVLATIAERSWMEALATRLEVGRDLVVFASERPEEASPGHLVYEWGTGRLVPDLPEPRREQVLLPPRGWTDLPPRGLVRASLLEDPVPEGLWVGRGLIGMGTFENADTDQEIGDMPGWKFESGDASLSSRGVAEGLTSLQLTRGPDNTGPVLVRTLGQVAMPPHRLYADAGATEPLDGEASYSIRLTAWASGETDGLTVRLDLYHVADADPTEAPVNVKLREVEIAVGMVEGAWRESLVDIPASALEPLDGMRPNAAIVNILLQPPQRQTTVVRLDRLELVEWRPAASQPASFGVVDLVRSDRGIGVVELDRLSWGDASR
jgi:poly-gamma-glutamate capsule biosynthesis protein CapA/YwtB (metallophosphatase superfamily)